MADQRQNSPPLPPGWVRPAMYSMSPVVAAPVQQVPVQSPHMYQESPASKVAFGATAPAPAPADAHSTSRTMDKLLGNPSTSCDVAFHKLNMTVNTPAQSCFGPKGTKTVLHEVSGIFQAGTFTAIMGSSGAGKTSLLNAIGGEAAGGMLSGRITVNGQGIAPDMMRRLRAFVFQDDVMMGTMTVREAITMSARLRLPQSMPIAQKIERVEQVMQILYLDKCGDTVMGYSEASNISGGERKRVGIAMELVTNPSIIMLDEPTSGLDAYTAYSVCRTLKDLALAGRTVVATIHQPSSDVFHMFDNLLLLADGHIMYQDKAAGVIDYFGQRGFPCPHHTNPADHIFMRILNDQDAMSPEDRQHAKAGVKKFLDEYTGSQRAAAIEAACSKAGPGVDVLQVATTAGLGTQISVLFARSKNNVVRNRLILRAKIGQCLFFGLLVGLIYYDVSDTQRGIQDRNGALFFISINIVMASTFGVLSAFIAERDVFERERSVGMYSTLAYFLSKYVMELPHNLILPFIQANIAYFLMGLQGLVDKWLVFCLLFVVLNNVGNSLGISLSCLFESLEVSLQGAPLIILPLVLFSGFFVNSNGIPVWFDWIKYLSPMKYSYEALMKNEYSDLKLTCESEELVSRPDCPPRRLEDGSLVMMNGKPMPGKCYCPTEEGEQVLDRMSLTDSGITVWQNVFILVGLWAGLVLIAYILLERRSTRRERLRSKLLSS